MDIKIPQWYTVYTIINIEKQKSALPDRFFVFYTFSQLYFSQT
jgi:hypothetical protein